MQNYDLDILQSEHLSKKKKKKESAINQNKCAPLSVPWHPEKEKVFALLNFFCQFYHSTYTQQVPKCCFHWKLKHLYIQHMGHHLKISHISCKQQCKISFLETGYFATASFTFFSMWHSMQVLSITSIRGLSIMPWSAHSLGLSKFKL